MSGRPVPHLVLPGLASGLCSSLRVSESASAGDGWRAPGALDKNPSQGAWACSTSWTHGCHVPRLASELPRQCFLIHLQRKVPGTCLSLSPLYLPLAWWLLWFPSQWLSPHHPSQGACKLLSEDCSLPCPSLPRTYPWTDRNVSSAGSARVVEETPCTNAWHN